MYERGASWIKARKWKCTCGHHIRTTDWLLLAQTPVGWQLREKGRNCSMALCFLFLKKSLIFHWIVKGQETGSIPASLSWPLGSDSACYNDSSVGCSSLSTITLFLLWRPDIKNHHCNLSNLISISTLSNELLLWHLP